MLLAFGFGLSYTSFSYGDAKLVEGTAGQAGPLTVTVPVRNTGKVAGREAVQVYLTSPDSTMPIQELKGFAKTRSLGPEEEENVTVELDGFKSFRRWSIEKDCWTVLPGEYTIRVSSSSRVIEREILVKV